MKIILIFSLIYFTLSIWGPAEEAARIGDFCGLSSFNPNTSSDCVDRNLYGLHWKTSKYKYLDRCCFVRFQLYGYMSAECKALTEEEYLDIVQTKKDLEKYYDERYRDEMIPILFDETNTEGYSTKIYQIDCSSSYIKFLSIASILLALLF